MLGTTPYTPCVVYFKTGNVKLSSYLISLSTFVIKRENRIVCGNICWGITLFLIIGMPYAKFIVKMYTMVHYLLLFY